MNRIGIALLLATLFISTSCICQNFFWSHTGGAVPCTEGYGLLYNWYAATDTRKISSSDDWSIPSSTQLNDLVTYLGGSSVAGGKLKETGYVYWDSPNTGATNEVGFSARGTGARSAGGTWGSIRINVHYWGSIYNASFAWFLLTAYNTEASTVNITGKKAGYAIRLVKSAVGVTDGTVVGYTGNDGGVYYAIAINELYWTKQNLRETKLRNGDIIPFHGADNDSTFTDVEWAALTTAGVCAHGNNLSNVGCDFTFPTE